MATEKLCIEVYRNGALVCRAGGEHMWHLFFAVSGFRKGEGWDFGDWKAQFVVHGMDRSELSLDENLHWVDETPLLPGDELTVRIVTDCLPTPHRSGRAFGTRTEGVDTAQYFCSFCGKSAEVVGMLIDRHANICHDCLRRHQPK